MRFPHQIKPCNNCPFRKDCLSGWLGEKRIKALLTSTSFNCHTTSGRPKKNSLRCAGHMLLLKEKNLYFLQAKVMNIDLGLQGKELVF